MNSKNPLVSFIVPVYNVEKYIECCICSCLEQDSSDYELIIIDDGSVDGSAEVCKQYATRNEKIKTVYQKNQGVSVARNEGLALARGEWICFVDGDDWVEPELVTILKQIRDSQYDIIFFAYNSVKAEKVERKINSELNNTVLNETDFLRLQMGILNQGDARLRKYNGIEGTPWAKVYRREFLQINNLHFTPGIRKGQDGLFNIQAYGMATCGFYHNQIVYNYRINEDSVCRRYNANISDYSLHLVEEYKKIIKETKNGDLEELFDYFVVRQFMYCILLNYCHHNNPNRFQIRKEHYLSEKIKYQTSIQRLKLKNMKTNEKGLLILMRYFPFGVLDKVVKLLK